MPQELGFVSGHAFRHATRVRVRIRACLQACRKSFGEEAPSGAAGGIEVSSRAPNMARSNKGSGIGKRAVGEISILPIAVSGEIRAGESLCARVLAATRSLDRKSV